MRGRNVFRAAVLLLWLMGQAGAARGAETAPPGALPPQYRKWLEEEVVYLISPAERKVFLQLQNDRERDLFIAAFWKHRDPTPETPENEYKAEHYRRMAHVNHLYGRSAPMPGWRTDRGRTYIILGEPMSTMNLENKPDIYPAEIWYYQNLSPLGLPDGLNLVFFQEQGVGDYKLYSPTRDGPKAFLKAYFGRPSDAQAAYEKIHAVEPALANASLSVIPGDTAVNMGHPSASSDLLLQKIAAVPWSKLEDLYARKFLQYKDRVEVEYSTNYVPCNSLLRIEPGASGAAFVHYAIELKSLSLGAYENKYYAALKVSGSAITPEGRPVFQFDKPITLNLSEEQLQEIRTKPFNIHDLFPLVPGRYQLNILVKNEVSKEFSSLEQSLVIPERIEMPRIEPLLIGYRCTPAAVTGEGVKPFQFGPFQVYSQPGNLFAQNEALSVLCRIQGVDDAGKVGVALRWQIVRDGKPVMQNSRPLAEFAAFPYCLENIPLSGLAPAYYTLKVSLLGGDRELATGGEDFAVSPQAALPRPWVYSRFMPAASDPQFMHVLGGQFYNLGRFETAKTWLERAHGLNPAAGDIALSLGQTYLALRETGKIPALLSRFLTDEKTPNYEIFFLSGQAWMNLGATDKAISTFSKAISLFGVNPALLNAIGGCYLKSGRPEDALAAWKKSLQLQPGQVEIQRLVASMKTKR